MLGRAVAERLQVKETTQMPDDQRDAAVPADYERVRQQEQQMEAAEQPRVEGEIGTAKPEQAPVEATLLPQSEWGSTEAAPPDPAP